MKTFAFISYARSDGADVANEIQRRLENYVVPKKVQKEGTPFPEGRFIRRVFVDTKDLSVVTTDFSEEIQDNLREAEYLIVVCSKASARDVSFVHKEISYFLETHNNDTDRILPIALDGVIADTIPEELHEVVARRNIIIWNRDWSSHDRRNRNDIRMAIFKIVEFLLRVDFQLLYDRYWMAYWRKVKIAIGVGICVATAIIGSLCMAIHESMEREKEANARVHFEKHVFPLSIDFSYVKAFAAPVIGLCTNEECVLLLAMPKNFDELGNSGGQKFKGITKDLRDLGWSFTKTELQIPFRPRPISTYELMPSSGKISGKKIYLDVVTQFSAVKSVVDYLTNNNKFYSHDNQTLERLTQEYVAEFKLHLERMLSDEFSNIEKPTCQRKWRVVYATDKDDLRKVLDRIRKD